MTKTLTERSSARPGATGTLNGMLTVFIDSMRAGNGRGPVYPFAGVAFSAHRAGPPAIVTFLDEVGDSDAAEGAHERSGGVRQRVQEHHEVAEAIAEELRRWGSGGVIDLGLRVPAERSRHRVHRLPTRTAG